MQLLFVFLFSVITICCGGDLPNYYMHDRCDGGIRMIKDDVHMARLKYSHLGNPGSINCTMYLRGHFDKTAIRFTEFSFPDCRSHLSIHIGDDYPSGRIVPGLEDIMCGPTSPRLGTIYTTDWTEIHMRVEGSALPVTHFTMLFNVFEDGRRCYKFEQYCKNGRCIDDSIKCNGFNPCGDESDCEKMKKMETGTIVGIALGSASGFLFILFLRYGLPKIVEWKVKRSRQASLGHSGDGSNTNGTNGSGRATNGSGRATTTENREITRSYRSRPTRTYHTSRDRSRTDSLTAYDIDLSDFTARDIDLSDFTSHDIDSAEALGFDSRPPAYSMIDYVSVPSGATGHSTEPSAHTANTNKDEYRNTNGVSDEQPTLPNESGDNGGDGQEEYIPPPPPYDVVVHNQNMYDVSEPAVHDYSFATSVDPDQTASNLPSDQDSLLISISGH